MQMKEKFSLHQNFSLKINDDGSKSIEGFAIHGDDDFIVNGFFEIPKSELKNCARTLTGAKLMKDHDTDHVDSIISISINIVSTYSTNRRSFIFSFIFRRCTESNNRISFFNRCYINWFHI